MKELVSVAFCATFRCRPGHAVAQKLALLIILALGGSILLYSTTETLALPSPQSSPFGYMCIAFGAQIITLSLLIGSPAFSGQSSLLQLMQVLPLRRSHQWIIWITPANVLIGLSTLVFLPSVMHIAHAMGYSVPLAALAYMGGSYAGLGIIAGIAIPLWHQRIVIALAYSAVQYICLRYSTDTTNPLFVSLYCILGIGALASLSRGCLPTTSLLKSRQTAHVTPIPHPSTWFFAKMVRNPTTRLGLFASLVLACILVGFCISQSFYPGAALWPAVTMLAAAIASDIRGTLPFRPPEITGLKGTIYFENKAIVSTFCVTVPVLAPLIILSAYPSWTLLAGAWIYCIAGTAVGLAVGTIFRPAPRDISAQFTTVICTLCCFLGIQQIPFVQSLPQSGLYIIYGIVALISFFTSICVEYKRNTFLWRNPS